MKSLRLLTLALAIVAGVSAPVGAQLPKPVYHPQPVKDCDGAVMWMQPRGN